MGTISPTEPAIAPGLTGAAGLTGGSAGRGVFAGAGGLTAGASRTSNTSRQLPLGQRMRWPRSDGSTCQAVRQPGQIVVIFTGQFR